MLSKDVGEVTTGVVNVDGGVSTLADDVMIGKEDVVADADDAWAVEGANNSEMGMAAISSRSGTSVCVSGLTRSEMGKLERSLTACSMSVGGSAAAAPEVDGAAPTCTVDKGSRRGFDSCKGLVTSDTVAPHLDVSRLSAMSDTLLSIADWVCE